MLNCVSDDGGRCSALDTKKCTTGCSFYMNKFQKAESDAKAAERLNSLSESKQECIAEKYYAGKMVWRDNEDDYVAFAV